jgi:CRISPR type III-B/RAMP module RAMP protein Cmr1
MDPLSYHFSLLSDTFAHGAYQTQNFNRPELRAPSVKGMIRWWHKALRFQENDAGVLFGQAIGETRAARVSIRVSPVQPVHTDRADFMPHKGVNGGTKIAIQPGSSYRLLITQRREPLSPILWDQLIRSTKAWLLLGGIGQRSNRGAGSPWPSSDAPQTPEQYLDTCRRLLVNTPVRVALLGYSSEHQCDLRDLAGRFPNTRDFNIAGRVFGSAVPRKPSPLKLRAVYLNGSHHLAAIWAPSNVGEDTARNLQAGIDAMIRIDGKRELGLLLKDALATLAS